MVYTDLIFDLYGTLVDIHTEESMEVWEKTALFFGFHGAKYTGQELKTAFHGILTQRESQEGQNYECHPDIPFEEVMETLFISAGVKENTITLSTQAAQLFRISSIEYLALYPYVKEALSALRARGHRLWLLTNAQRAFTEYELRYLGLHDLFDDILISSDFRCRKPDPRFFRALLDRHQLDPQRCLMIGNDRCTDIAGAKSVGLATLYMHTNLTPADQACAAPSLAPGTLPSSSRHFEYEGSCWKELTTLIMNL